MLQTTQQEHALQQARHNRERHGLESAVNEARHALDATQQELEAVQAFAAMRDDAAQQAERDVTMLRARVTAFESACRSSELQVQEWTTKANHASAKLASLRSLTATETARHEAEVRRLTAFTDELQAALAREKQAAERRHRQEARLLERVKADWLREQAALGHGSDQGLNGAVQPASASPSARRTSDESQDQPHTNHERVTEELLVASTEEMRALMEQVQAQGGQIEELKAMLRSQGQQ